MRILAEHPGKNNSSIQNGGQIMGATARPLPVVNSSGKSSSARTESRRPRNDGPVCAPAPYPLITPGTYPHHVKATHTEVRKNVVIRRQLLAEMDC